jgi:hypothetical protein
MFYHLSYAPSLFFFSAVLGFELRAYTLSHSASPFLQKVFFEIGSPGTICLDWLQTVILLIPVSGIARIPGVSPQCLAVFCF